jgi:N,N'-diacetyllegionaminate synthase
MNSKLNQKRNIFVIAEIGNNHEGKIINAKKMINLAAKAGADAVKFQTFNVDEFINKENKKRYKQLKRFQLTQNQFLNLKKYADKKKIHFLSTPFDIESAKFLIKFCDIIKISSGDNDFFFLLKEVIKSNKKIIISTGMTSKKEIDKILSFLKKYLSSNNIKKRISFLHCVSSYPVKHQDANLNSINFLQKKYRMNIGYSDHTVGPEASIIAMTLGAKIIEKHFTIDKKFSKFRDHKISADFQEMKYIVNCAKNLSRMLGSHNKQISKVERKNMMSMKRSAYASKEIKKGETITLEKLRFLRPRVKGTTLDPRYLIGKKTKKKISENHAIFQKDLK